MKPEEIGIVTSVNNDDYVLMEDNGVVAWVRVDVFVEVIDVYSSL